METLEYLIGVRNSNEQKQFLRFPCDLAMMQKKIVWILATRDETDNLQQNLTESNGRIYLSDFWREQILVYFGKSRQQFNCHE